MVQCGYGSTPSRTQSISNTLNNPVAITIADQVMGPEHEILANFKRMPQT